MKFEHRFTYFINVTIYISHLNFILFLFNSEETFSMEQLFCIVNII